MEPSDKSNRPGIFRHQRVGRYEREPFNHRLGNEHAVKWVLVNGRQARQRDRVSAGRRNLAVAIFGQAPGKGGDIDAKVIAAATGLDRDFPQADSAEHQLAIGILEQRTA